MYRVPFLKVLGPGGDDQVPGWGNKLIGVTLIDRAGYESDEALFRFTRKQPVPIPPLNTPFVVLLGWSTTGAQIVGHYTFQRVQLSGDPSSGHVMELVCRAGDFVDKLKHVASQHYDAKNGHKTLGDVFRTLFKPAGKPVVIAPEIDRLPIPGGYLLRWIQSAIAFATDLADDNGAVVKPMGGKIVVMKRNAGQSGSGKALAPIVVRFNPSYGYDIELEPRFSYGTVAVPWFDKHKGRIAVEKKTKKKGHSRDGVPHPASSKHAAKATADAVSDEWGRFTGKGHFDVVGYPAAVAEAPVRCIGFGDPIDTVPWQSSAVTHNVVPERGWTTTIEVETTPS